MTTKELEQQVFWLFNSKIVEGTFRELLDEARDETTTPNGVAPRYHIRLTDEAAQAEHDNGDNKATINNGYELWSWGIAGNHPYNTGLVFDTYADAELALYDTFKIDLESGDMAWAYDKEELERDFADEIQ